jgi:hypothetical protein
MSSNRSRRIAALRALAERPGTPQEGIVAKKKLEEALATEPSSTNPFPDANSYTIQLQEFLRRFNECFEFTSPCYRNPFAHHSPPPEEGDTYYVPAQCPCGAYLSSRGNCTFPETHKHKRWKAKREFPEGSIVDCYSPSTNSVILEAKVLRYLEDWNLVEIRRNGSGSQIVQIYENGVCCLHRSPQ